MRASKSNAPPSDASIATVLASLLVWESAVSILRASGRPFWYDEILTLDLATLRPFSRVLKALQAGVDGMPPAYHLITRLASHLPVDPRIALRLPSVLGYILTLLGIYWFARKRLSALAALFAVLLTVLSPLSGYAVEARSYALMVGFLAMAAACWQRIGERRFMTPLFALFLTLAVSMHSFTVLVISVFWLAELVRYFAEQRQIRWGVWTASAVAFLPFLLALPLLLGLRHALGKHHWSPSTWGMTLSTYGEYLPPGGYLSGAVAGLIGAMLLYSLLRRLRASQQAASAPDPVPVSEVALLAGFLFYPAALVTLTTLLHGGYVPRYGWPAILGIALGSTYLLRGSKTRPRRLSPNHLAGALLIGAGLHGFVQAGALLGAGPNAKNAEWIRLSELSRDQPGVPVVIGSGLDYVEAVQYAPPALCARLLEVADVNMALRFVGTDMIDRGNLILSQFVPLRIEDLAAFEAAHRRFILRSGRNPNPSFDWFTQYLKERQYHFTLMSKDEDGLTAVYLVER